MKVLFLVMDEQRVLLDSLYEAVRSHCQVCDVVRLTSAEQSNLAPVLRKHKYRDYDRVVVFSRLKRQRNQVLLFQCIPNLVFLEHDACQNYMDDSRYKGLYADFYRSLPWTRVLVSGCQLAMRLREEGVDAFFVSKGYDEQLFRNYAVERDIPVGFIGSVKSDVYRSRRRILEAISSRTKILVERTNSGEEYVSMLNRVRIFVSADVGMGEYMIKNFEAMACGCVLLAWRQGEMEETALGFKDGVNVMLYSSVDEALEKIQLLHADSFLAERIAREGQLMAEQYFTFSRVGKDLARCMEHPMRAWPGLSLWRRIWARMRYGM